MVRIEDIGKGTMVKIRAKCDVCQTEKEIGYRKYFKNYNKYQIYSCSNKCSMFKNIKTNLEKYGVTHQCKMDSVVQKSIQTKIVKGLVTYNFEDYEGYRRVVNNLTNSKKKELFNNWDGLDYYDNEYIKDYTNLTFNDVRYPCIDHKTSVLYGFNNGINPEEISDISNLCLTKRSNNSLKQYMCENEFKTKMGVKL